MSLSIDDPPNSRLFVVVGRNTDSEYLREVFDQFGQVVFVKYLRDKGVAYVKYDRASSAALAIENLHEVTLNDGQGPRLKVMLADSPHTRVITGLSLRRQTEDEAMLDPDNTPPRSRLFLVVPKNADSTIIEAELSRLPRLQYCKTDLIASKGIVFVKYAKSSSACLAMETVQATGTLAGYRVKIMLAEPKTRRGNGPTMLATGIDSSSINIMGVNMGVTGLGMVGGGGSGLGGGMHLDSPSSSSAYLAGLLGTTSSSAVLGGGGESCSGGGGLLLPHNALGTYHHHQQQQHQQQHHSGYGNVGSQMIDHSSLLAAAAAAAAAAGGGGGGGGGTGLDFSALQSAAAGYDGGGLREGTPPPGGMNAHYSQQQQQHLGLSGFHSGSSPSLTGMHMATTTPGGNSNSMAGQDVVAGNSNSQMQQQFGSFSTLPAFSSPPMMNSNSINSNNSGGGGGGGRAASNISSSGQQLHHIPGGGILNDASTSSSSSGTLSKQRLFVVVAKQASEEVVSSIFRTFPGMESCDLKRDRNTGASKGYAYVYYSTPEAAAAAQMQLNGLEFPLGSGYKLKVMFAEPLGSAGSYQHNNNNNNKTAAATRSGSDTASDIGGDGGGTGSINTGPFIPTPALHEEALGASHHHHNNNNAGTTTTAGHGLGNGRNSNEGGLVAQSTAFMTPPPPSHQQHGGRTASPTEVASLQYGLGAMSLGDNPGTGGNVGSSTGHSPIRSGGTGSPWQEYSPESTYHSTGAGGHQHHQSLSAGISPIRPTTSSTHMNGGGGSSSGVNTITPESSPLRDTGMAVNGNGGNGNGDDTVVYSALPRSSRPSDHALLTHVFSQCGPVEFVRIMGDDRIAMVKYADASGARKAVGTLDGADVLGGGETLHVGSSPPLVLQ